MQVSEIVVTAGRTFNHPYEQYSNLRPSVTVKATLGDGEDASDAVKQLQAKAEALVEDHKQNMLSTLRRLYELGETERQITNIERELTDAQMRLKDLKVEREGLRLSAPEAETHDGDGGEKTR